MELRRDGAGAAGALLVAVAGARGAEFGVDGGFEVVYGALGGTGVVSFLCVVGGGREEGRMYPVIDGRLRRHPGLSDSRAMSEDYMDAEGASTGSHWSGSLNPRMVDPLGNVGAALTKPSMTVRKGLR